MDGFDRGRTFIVIPWDGDGARTKEEIISRYTRAVERWGIRQKENIEVDMHHLAELPDGTYVCLMREWAGHQFTPKRVRYGSHLISPVFISETVWWGMNARDANEVM